jgi:hypothetical protein
MTSRSCVLSMTGRRGHVGNWDICSHGLTGSGSISATWDFYRCAAAVLQGAGDTQGSFLSHMGGTARLEWMASSSCVWILSAAFVGQAVSVWGLGAGVRQCCCGPCRQQQLSS